MSRQRRRPFSREERRGEERRGEPGWRLCQPATSVQPNLTPYLDTKITRYVSRFVGWNRRFPPQETRPPSSQHGDSHCSLVRNVVARLLPVCFHAHLRSLRALAYGRFVPPSGGPARYSSIVTESDRPLQWRASGDSLVYEARVAQGMMEALFSRNGPE